MSFKFSSRFLLPVPLHSGRWVVEWVWRTCNRGDKNSEILGPFDLRMTGGKLPLLSQNLQEQKLNKTQNVLEILHMNKRGEKNLSNKEKVPHTRRIL